MSETLARRFRFSSEELKELESERGLSTDRLLSQLAREVAAFAQVPVSNFHVGAAGLNSDGEVFLGVNLEFVGGSFAQTIHAEQFLLSLSRTCSSAPLVKLAVTDPPCGHCRQFMAEFDTEGELQLTIAEEESVTLGQILPRAFGPADMNVTEPFYSKTLVLNDSMSLEEASKEAARCSYVPYSKTRAGTSVRGACGRIFAGSALENAAFNPALPPLQAAIVSAFANGCDPSDIVEVVLCQEKGGLIDYEPQIRDLTHSLSSRDVVFRSIYL